MPNILTDGSTVYGAAAVFSGVKSNAVARTAAETDTYVTSQWGEEVDTALLNVAAFFEGTAGAGQLGTFMSMIGGFECAENAGFAGASGSDVVGTGIAVGDSAVDTNDIQIQSTVSSRVLFGSPADVDVGILLYEHSTETFVLTADATSFGVLGVSSSVFGTGAASHILGVDGGSTSGLEPSLSLRQGGVEVCALEAQTDGRLEVTATGGIDIPTIRAGLRIGTNDTASASHGLMFYNGSRLVVRNEANSAYQPLQTSELYIGSGITISSGSGSPEGVLTRGRGSWYIDESAGQSYIKSTTTGNTGWSVQGGGGSSLVHYESFSFDRSTSSTDCWVSFGGFIAEVSQSSTPRTYCVWSVPFTGTVGSVRITSEFNPGVTSLQFYETDRVTTIGVAGTGTATLLFGSVHAIDYTFLTPVDLTEGQRVLLRFNITGPVGEVSGNIELTE